MIELQDQVLMSLRRIIRATDLYSRKLRRETGLTTPQLVVMGAVAELNNPTVSDVARSVSLSQATVTTILNRLENSGLIERVRSAADRRRVNLSLTAAGQQLLMQAPKPLQDEFSQRFAALEPWEQHHIVASLARVASMMDAETLDAAPLLATDETVF